MSFSPSRKCNTEKGTLACWKSTTDGFAYGLSTAMIDFCQTILALRNLPGSQVSPRSMCFVVHSIHSRPQESWRTTSREILQKQIADYDLAKGTRQLTKEEVTQAAVLLLDKVCSFVSVLSCHFPLALPSASMPHQS